MLTTTRSRRAQSVAPEAAPALYGARPSANTVFFVGRVQQPPHADQRFICEIPLERDAPLPVSCQAAPELDVWGLAVA